MSIPLDILLLLIWTHFVADFILQTHEMATKKSSRNKWLLLHVAVYTIPFLMFGWLFALVNGIAHLIVDYFTSRITTKLHKKGETHWFFVVIGFDQALHATTLILTYMYFI